MTYTVNEAVEQTLQWVTHGEPNPDDILDVATDGFAVVGRYGGFKANDRHMVAVAEFVSHDGSSHAVISLLTPDGTVELTVDGEQETHPTHEAGVRTFFEWAARQN